MGSAIFDKPVNNGDDRRRIVAMARAQQPKYQVNRRASNGYAMRLESYLTEHVWDPDTRKAWSCFKCRHKHECKASARAAGASFHEAQGHSVGSHYALSTSDGVPLRVLVVPMEAGGGGHYFSVNARTKAVRDSGDHPWYKNSSGKEPRNAHMKGVTLALRLALKLPYNDGDGSPLVDSDTERVGFTDGSAAHLFECFAMANLLLCSAVDKSGSQKSKANTVMRDNCAEHLKKTVEILEPTLVISQGWSLVDTLWNTLGVTHQTKLDAPNCYLTDCRLNGNRFTWVALYHPTRNWSSIKQPYFKETVVPATTAARKRALELAQPT